MGELMRRQAVCSEGAREQRREAESHGQPMGRGGRLHWLCAVAELVSGCVVLELGGLKSPVRILGVRDPVPSINMHEVLVSLDVHPELLHEVRIDAAELRGAIARGG